MDEIEKEAIKKALKNTTDAVKLPRNWKISERTCTEK